MEFARKIYQLNFRRLILQLMPVRLRMPKLTSLFLSLTSPVGVLYAQFVGFKKEVEYQITVTPQVCYLVKMLNDQFDYSLRRIIIRDPQYFDTLQVYTRAEQRIRPLYTRPEAQKLVPYKSAEGSVAGEDFIIVLPLGFSVDIEAISSKIKKHCLPTKKFTITYE